MAEILKIVLGTVIGIWITFFMFGIIAVIIEKKSKK